MIKYERRKLRTIYYEQCGEFESEHRIRYNLEKL